MYETIYLLALSIIDCQKMSVKTFAFSMLITFLKDHSTRVLYLEHHHIAVLHDVVFAFEAEGSSVT